MNTEILQENLRLQEVLVDDFDEDGECWEGMANRVHAMSHLDRMIAEDCVITKSGKVLAPHLNTDNGNSKIPGLAKALDIEFEEAQVLNWAWRVIGMEFPQWVEARSIEKALPWFIDLAQNLETAQGDTEENLSKPIDSWDWKEGSKRAGSFSTLWLKEELEGPGTAFGYHRLSSDSSEPDWLELQPARFANMYRKIEAMKDLDSLAKVSKQAFRLKIRDKQAAKALWELKDRQKAKFINFPNFGLAGRALISKIKKANGGLGSIGIQLHKMQTGKIKLAQPVSNAEWSKIWQVYNQRKTAIHIPKPTENPAQLPLFN